MSRTNRPNKFNYDTHPYWLYGYCHRHGAAHIRRLYNRLDRARAKAAMRRGEDPPRVRRYMGWIYS